MTASTFQWDLTKPRDIFVPECGYRIGLASRNLAHDLKLRPRGKVMRDAVAIAQRRQDRLVRVEYLLVALGEFPMSEVGVPGQQLRASMARLRKKQREAQALALAEAKRAKRRARAK